MWKHLVISLEFGFKWHASEKWTVPRRKQFYLSMGFRDRKEVGSKADTEWQIVF